MLNLPMILNAAIGPKVHLWNCYSRTLLRRLHFCIRVGKRVFVLRSC